VIPQDDELHDFVSCNVPFAERIQHVRIDLGLLASWQLIQQARVQLYKTPVRRRMQHMAVVLRRLLS
jgi:hypothetical protein